MLRWVCGTLEIEVTGAGAERCLNRWAQADLPFWRLCRMTQLVFRCRVYESQLPLLRREAARAQCELRVLRRSGLPSVLERLRVRPVLACGLVLAIAVALFLQSFVWFVRVEGNDRISEASVLHALYEEGVRFGAWGASLDSEALKNRMLNRVPALRWLAVNREGGVVTVLCAERETEEPPLETAGITHLVATRPGVVRALHVINGFAAKEPGDVVLPGDVLISGVMEWTTHIQATRAMGEVYADTLHDLELICPAEGLKKTYTGREKTCKTIIFQRNRIFLSGNSGIFGSMCDRMIHTNVWTLPGGYALPIEVETVTLLEYKLEPVPLSGAEARRLLDGEALRQTQAEMVAGTVQEKTVHIQKKQDSYLCRAALNCMEVISKTVPAELFGEDEENGEIDQRRTD